MPAPAPVATALPDLRGVLLQQMPVLAPVSVAEAVGRVLPSAPAPRKGSAFSSGI